LVVCYWFFVIGDWSLECEIVDHPRRCLVVLATAVIMALAASSAAVVLDTLAGTALTPAVFACDHPGGECG